MIAISWPAVSTTNTEVAGDPGRLACSAPSATTGARRSSATWRSCAGVADGEYGAAVDDGPRRVAHAPPSRGRARARQRFRPQPAGRRTRAAPRGRRSDRAPRRRRRRRQGWRWRAGWRARACPRKFHSSVPSEPERQKTWPSLVTTNTRSAAAVGEVRNGESRFFSQSLLAGLGIERHQVAEAGGRIDAPAVGRQPAAEPFLVLLVGRRRGGAPHGRAARDAERRDLACGIQRVDLVRRRRSGSPSACRRSWSPCRRPRSRRFCRLPAKAR